MRLCVRLHVHVCVFVCDRVVKPPFDNAPTAGRPAVAPSYRSQLGKSEIERMKRRKRKETGGG